VKVVWTPEAEQDRAHIWTYIAADNPRAAARMDQLFSDAAAKLADFPMLGRAGRIPGTRELIPHESYRLVYGIEGDVAWVLALVHTARRWPPLPEESRKRARKSPSDRQTDRRRRDRRK
jgi:addiction module RelE/StbE family toxin